MCYSRIHGNLGLNKLVNLRHLLLSFLSDFILLKVQMKPSSYGLVHNMQSAWRAEINPGLHFFVCQPFSPAVE